MQFCSGVDSGFYPITNPIREKELKRLGLPALAN